MGVRAAACSLATILLASTVAGAQEGKVPNLGTEAQIAEGKALYAKYCSQCHGEDGDGQGIAAPFLDPRPRDFTQGKYKIRSTPTGALPTDEDVKRSIREGLPYTGMPAFGIFTDTQLTSLTHFLKTFSDSFQDPSAYLEAFPIPEPPKTSEATAARGREVYEATGCARCHGELGRGDGLSAPTLVDDWGHFIRVADLTKPWTFRGGGSRRDIYRTMRSGFFGTPMPGFAPDSLSDEDAWAIVDYIKSLSGGAEKAPYANLVRAVPTTADLDVSLGKDLFAEAPAAMLPVIGQIMEPGRSFHPPVTAVTVQAVYDRDEIAFLVRWNDMRAETSGENGPDLEVPPWADDQAEPADGAEEEGGGGFWGDEEAADPADDGGSFWGEEEVAADSADGGGDFWGEGDDGAAGTPSEVESEFSDAVALQFPAATPVGIRKPYFIFGDIESAVELWFADLATGEARLYEGRGSENVIASDSRPPEMTSAYEQGEWSVIFKRRLSGPGIPFVEGEFLPIAATVWDGFNRERGNKRGLTAWYNVYLEPADRPSPVGPMARAGLGVLVLELLVIALVRRKYRKNRAAGTWASPEAAATGE